MKSMKAFLGRAFGKAQKVLIAFFIFVGLLALFSYFFVKDTPRVNLTNENKTREEIYSVINDPKTNGNPVGKLSIFAYRSLLCGLIGEACTENPSDGDKNFEGSLYGQAVNWIVLPYRNPPASGLYWAYDGLQNAGFISKTHAAEGIGFASLKPIQNMWKVFRDFAYLLIVLVIMTIGFMIMFRVKINPQTVIRLENSLPRIVLALLLITFSFAIAGFLIDLMYLVIVVAISAIAQVNIGRLTPADIPSLQNKYIGAGMFQLWPFEGDPFQVGLALVNVLPGIVRGIFKGLIAFVVARAITHVINTPDTGLSPAKMLGAFKNQGAGGGFNLSFLGGAEGSVNFGNLIDIPITVIDLILFLGFFTYAAGILVGLIFALTLFALLFRLLFVVFSAYIKILLLVIFSPLIFLIGAIPGRNMVSWWFKNILAELSTFPIIIVIMLIGYAITNSPLADGRFFKPPFLYGIDPESLAVLIGMGVVLMLPNLLKKIKEVVFGIKGQGLGISAGLFFGGVTGAYGAATQQLSTYYYSSQALKSIGEARQNKKGIFGLFSGGGGGGGKSGGGPATYT